MKKNLLFVLLMYVPLSVYSQSLKFEPYVEGSLGYFKGKSISEGNFKYDSGFPITDYSIQTGGDGVVNYGLELGLRNIFVDGLRFGLSETYQKLTNLKTNGYITTNQNGNLVTKQENDVSAGDASINLILLNGYYDFNIEHYQLKPYVGLGVGIYSNNRMIDRSNVWSMMIGLNYPITENIYLGIKGTYYFLGDTTVSDGSNNTFSSTNSYSISGVLGYKF